MALNLPSDCVGGSSPAGRGCGFFSSRGPGCAHRRDGSSAVGIRGSKS
jgi:hypothetical protein